MGYFILYRFKSRHDPEVIFFKQAAQMNYILSLMKIYESSYNNIDIVDSGRVLNDDYEDLCHKWEVRSDAFKF